MSRPDRPIRSRERDTQMTTIESVAIDAVRSGRYLAEAWPEAAVEHTSSFDKLIAATLARCAVGEVFDKVDDHALRLMLGAISQTLDGYRQGCGTYFRNECTAEAPFYEREPEQVRRLGELVKSFVKVRQEVIDTIIAEKQLVSLRRR